MRIITEALGRLELALFPSKCKICSRGLSPGERVICRECLSDFPVHDGAGCPVCGKPYFSPSAISLVCGECLKGRPFLKHRSAGLYEGSLRRTILLYKYGGYENLARHLAEFALERVRDLWDADCITPVPAHRRRIRERGFDHTWLLSKKLSSFTGIKAKRLLMKTKYTPPQAGLPKGRRLENPKGSFALRKRLPCSRVLLLDDVWTTGATITEASRILKRAGYEVYALTLARSV